MPEPIDEILQNLSPQISETVTEQRIQRTDGTHMVVTRKIERITKEGGGIRNENIDETVLDDMGRRIDSPKDIGGQCTCGRLVQKDYFYICTRCGRPKCLMCVSMVDRLPYCSWCAFYVSLRHLLGIR